MRASGGVRRAHREVRPSTCSAKVTAAQPGLPQKKRRTASRMTTGWPPTGASASRRPYVLCTRPDAWPHRGHTALASAGTDPQAQAARQLGGFHDHPGQVRQQPLQADLMLA